ncbi:MAG: hypothetical protein GPJ25_24150, partial [Microcystis aeruginosa LE13-04]|nr:hypothetical protein [Microcystis aeruginosa LE13-04]
GRISLNNINYTVNENGTANITLTRTNGSDGEVSVILTPSNGSATAGDDYTNTPITVTFANGQTSKTVTIPITDDSIYEPTETVNLTISNPTGGATLGTQQTATLTIIDNDAVPGVIQFSNATYSVNENGTPVTAVTLTRSNGSDGAVSVRINLTNGTATAPSDYNNTPITANFANGETSKTIEYASISQGLSFDGINDRVESNQLFANTTDTFTIEFWAKPTATRNLTTESNSGTAGTSGQRYAIYPVQGEAASLGTNHAGVGVSVGTNGISIFEHSSFYLPSPLVYQNTISDWTHIAIVYNNKTPSLYVNGQFIKTGIKSNYIVHPSLQLGVNTGGSSNYGAYQGQLDDVRIWNKSRTQAEIQANFNRELTGNESGLVGYWNFNTVNNNTVQDLSSNQNDGTVFGAQSSTGFVPITNNPTIFIVNDTQFEPNETVNLTLSNPTGGATLGTQTTAVLTILNDDLPQRGTINLNNSNYTVNENGTANITLTRTNGSDGEVSVILTPSNGSATAGDDYTNTPITVTFANGQTSKTVTIPITDDSIYELTETVNLTISNPTGGATLGTQQTAILTIIDNDAVPGVIQFSNATYSVNENGTPVTAVTLTRTNGSDGEVSVRINLTNGTATAPSDYNNTAITVNFANGETSKTVNIPIVNDTQFEADETVNLSLSNPTGGATLGTQTTAVLTILNDDL